VEVRVEGLENFALKGVDLTVGEGEVVALVGPTGAGKTTLLNAIAGLVPYKGKVKIGQNPIDHLPPERRQVGYLFQGLALFPHMTVWENVAFGLKAKGLKGQALEQRVEEVLELLRISHLRGRYPKDLSGGEAQRVALGRTLAPWPRVLLLDEPFSKLDLRTSKYLRTEFKRLQRSLKITTIFVTHNVTEAFEMGDRVALMAEGKIQQVGIPEELMFKPSNDLVSRYFGGPNVFECRSFTPLDSGLAQVDVGGLLLLVPHTGKKITRISFLPWNVHLSKDPPPGPNVNRLMGAVEKVEHDPPFVRVELTVGPKRILVEMEEETYNHLGLRPKDHAYVVLPLRAISTLESEL